MTTTQYMKRGNRYRVKLRRKTFEGVLAGWTESSTRGIAIVMKCPENRFIAESDILEIEEIYDEVNA